MNWQPLPKREDAFTDAELAAAWRSLMETRQRELLDISRRLTAFERNLHPRMTDDELRQRIADDRRFQSRIQDDLIALGTVIDVAKRARGDPPDAPVTP